jgi:ligand-binding sensor domain-containing protein/two-component sensor histidine kinase
MKRSALGIRVLATLTLTVVACTIASQAFALDPQKTITQFKHQSWGIAKGIDAVYSVAQTEDGYIWIYAGNGLFRFDGVAFTRWVPNPGDPDLPGIALPILGSKDGSLWLGCANGVLQLKHGSSRLWTLKDGSLAHVRGLYETKDGTIWFGGFSLSRLVNGQLEIIEPMTSRDREFCNMVEDLHGNLWVAIDERSQKIDTDGLFAFLPKGESRLQLYPQRSSTAIRLQVQNNGKIWAAQTRRSVRAFTKSGPEIEFLLPEIQVGSNDILFDRDGAFWVTTLGDGLFRIRNIDALGTNNVGRSDLADHFSQKDGLSSDIVRCIFEDREGNIWVGTSAGLDCFRENKITSLSVREGLPFDQNLVVQSAGDGSLWVGSGPRGFQHLAGGRGVFVDRKWLNIQPAAEKEKTLLSVYCMLTTPQGQVLAGTGWGVITLHTNGTGEYLALPGGLELTHVEAMTVDAQGGLWLCDSKKGTYRILDAKAEVIQLPHRPLVAHCDDTGRMWFSHRDGSLGSYKSGQYTQYPAGTKGLAPGVIRAVLSESGGKAWFAGVGGLSYFDGSRFQALTRKNGLPEENLFVALRDDRGLYWFAGMDHIFSVTPESLQEALGSDSRLACAENLGFDDGLRGFIRLAANASALRHPLGIKGLDGRLWFCTGGGLAVVNPRLISKNQTPPPVHIERLIAGGKTYQKLNSVELPIGVRSCNIEYVGLSFANPAKVRYRYKLEDYDKDWVDAGPNRQALYSNLKPRKYKFQVVACNNDGVWNEKGDSIEFAILPAFYETAWFPLLCALPAGIAVWGLYRLRLARVTARMNQQLKGQIKERKRIAQELHDTLLQGFTGIGLKLDAITGKLPESLSETKEQLRKILDQSDQYLTEARRSVWELRSTSLEKTDDFAEVLSGAGERIVEGTGIHLTFSVNGDQRKLPGATEDNLLRICEEAITNAVKHARPKDVNVRLEFGDQKVVLRIKDNGCGFDPQGPEATKAGHFGLTGLQERARTIGGNVFLSSQPGRGTEITVSVDTL